MVKYFSFNPYPAKKRVSMIRKCKNHRSQTKPRHHEEETPKQTQKDTLIKARKLQK